MSFSEVFIRRPVGTSLLMVALLLGGLLGYGSLAVSALPEVDYPTIVVSTSLPGASPETIVSAVTTPLERQFGQVPSLESLTSVSSLGSSQITLQFSLDRNIDAAEQDVQAAINAASNLLPRTLPAPPTYSKSNPADTPVLTLAITSERLPMRQVADYADSILAQKISQVSGVGLVTSSGGQKPAVRVQVDPEALAGLGLSLEDVRAAVAAANVNQPKGTLDGQRQAYTIATDDQLQEAADYASIVLAYKQGAPLRLSAVANVIDGVENAQLAAWADEAPAIILSVQRQPGANVIEVADRVKALLPTLKTSLPVGAELRILSDRTETVRASVEDVQFTLILTVLLVVAVMYAFLKSLRATFIPSVTVPLSLVGTFGVMYFLDFSLNNLTLMALTISTGFVVDDAIVMIENITRYIEEGEDPLSASLKGARQIGFTILSLTVSLIAVLIPLLFMGGVVGRLFREFAVTLSVAIVVSAILSLTLTPMMCAHLLSPKALASEGSKKKPDLVDRMIAGYDRGLRWVFAHQTVTMVVTVLTLVLTLVLAVVVPKGFFPQQDTGLLVGATEASPDVSFSRLAERQQALVDLIRQDRDVESVASSIGADGQNLTASGGRLSIALRPRKLRSASAEAVLTRLSAKLATVEGITAHLQSVQDLQLDNRVARTQYQYTLESADPVELHTWSRTLLGELRALPELRDVASDQESMGLEASLVIDRDTASRLGVGAQAVDDTLYDAFGQRPISTIFTQLNQYRVILEVKPEFQRSPDALDHIYARSDQGAPVALSAFARYEAQPAALSISHQSQFPAITLSFNLGSGFALGEAVAAIHAAERRVGLPPTITADFQGAAQAFQRSLASEPFLVLAALITVYIVLGVLYESLIHPITILSTLPSAGVGAILALMLFREDFSVIALIGIILLIGIVKKNAIMMIDVALEAERERGLSPEASIHEACLLRFRPIMMTTLAALLGGLPLALGSGTGAELRRPLGISIVGGLLISQVLTLYTTPIVYLWMERLARRFRRFRRGAPASSPASLAEAP